VASLAGVDGRPSSHSLDRFSSIWSFPLSCESGPQQKPIFRSAATSNHVTSHLHSWNCPTLPGPPWLSRAMSSHDSTALLSPASEHRSCVADPAPRSHLPAPRSLRARTAPPPHRNTLSASPRLRVGFPGSSVPRPGAPSGSASRFRRGEPRERGTTSDPSVVPHFFRLRLSPAAHRNTDHRNTVFLVVSSPLGVKFDPFPLGAPPNRVNAELQAIRPSSPDKFLPAVSAFSSYKKGLQSLVSGLSCSAPTRNKPSDAPPKNTNLYR
jgi:hypothetical protein